MNTQNLLILGVLGVGVWWLWDRDRKEKAADEAAALAASRMAHTQIWDPSSPFILKGQTPKSVRTYYFDDVAVKTGEA